MESWLRILRDALPGGASPGTAGPVKKVSKRFLERQAALAVKR